MQRTTNRTRPVITCDGTGVVSHAGTVLLAELADRIGLTAALSQATDGLRERRAGHDPGRSSSTWWSRSPTGPSPSPTCRRWLIRKICTGRPGRSPRPPTIWRVLAGIDQVMLSTIQLARAQAGTRAWTARGELPSTELPGSRAAEKTIAEVVIDLDATLRW